MKRIAGMVTPGLTAADIGTDHGYVPLYLLRSGLIPKAIAVDISPGSLEKARENAQRFHLEDRMDFRCCDGLSGLKEGEAQCIIISGMGGILMNRILNDGKKIVLSAREVILSPHRDLDLVVRFLTENGFEVAAAEEIEDKKKKYHIIKGVNKNSCPL